MSVSDNPFEDLGVVRDQLYARGERLARRVGALTSAKVRGSDPLRRVSDLAHRLASTTDIAADLGVGRGGATAALTAALPRARVIALDISVAMLDATLARSPSAWPVKADFSRLPITGAAIGLAVVAFSLYHSPEPLATCAELRRVLRRGGYAAFLTKAAGSYQEIDRLVAACGLDAQAQDRPSLYRSFHSGNAERVVASAFDVCELDDEEHVFIFETPEHLAAYVATSPKYPAITSVPARDVVRSFVRVWPRGGLVTSSTVTWCLGRCGD